MASTLQPRFSLLFPVAVGTLFFSLGHTETIPTFGSPGYNISVVEGESITLRCRVFNRGSFTVWWIGRGTNTISRDTEILYSDSRFSVNHRLSDEWNLQIEDVRLDDAGLYSCVVSLNAINNRKDIYLTVIRLPTIVLGSSSKTHQVSVENATVQFRCAAEGFPKPQLTWYHRGKQLTASRDGGTLTLQSVSRSCEGQYECRAHIPSHQQSASHYINLVVHYLPEIRTVRNVVRQQQAEEALLECDVNMNPVSGKAQGIMWLDKNNREVLHSNRHLVRVDPLSDYGRRTSLRIRQLRQHDFGLYTCVAYNVLGTAKSTVLLEEIRSSTTRTPSTSSLPRPRSTRIASTLLISHRSPDAATSNSTSSPVKTVSSRKPQSFSSSENRNNSFTSYFTTEEKRITSTLPTAAAVQRAYSLRSCSCLLVACTLGAIVWR